jgi:hypothetical protein
MELLGARIGLLGREDSTWVRQGVQEQRPLLDSIAHPAMPVMHAMSMLRASAHPRLHYVTRVMPPPTVRDGAKDFDDGIASVAQRKLRLPVITDEQQELLQLPIRNGGVGMAQHSKLCDAAFFASAAASVPFVTKTVAALEGVDTATAQQQQERSWWYKQVEGAHATIVRPGSDAPRQQHQAPAAAAAPAPRAAARADVPGGVPLSMRGGNGVVGFWGSFNNDSHPKLQRLITAHRHAGTVRRVAETDRVLHTQLTSASSRRASLWLSSKPNANSGHYLPDEHAVIALRQRIRAPLFNDLPPTCICGEKASDVARRGPEFYTHVHWCKRAKAEANTLRHNIIVTTIASIARLANVTVRVELTRPTFSAVLNRDRALRPDLLLMGAMGSKFVDVAVCQSNSPWRERSNQLARDGADRTLPALAQLERDKTNKYRRLAEQYNADFVPFACDVYGAMGPQAHALVEWIIHEASITGRFETHTERLLFRTQAYTRLSIALQRATATGAVNAARLIRSRVASAALAQASPSSPSSAPATAAAAAAAASAARRHAARSAHPSSSSSSSRPAAGASSSSAAAASSQPSASAASSSSTQSRRRAAPAAAAAQPEASNNAPAAGVPLVHLAQQPSPAAAAAAALLASVQVPPSASSSAAAGAAAATNARRA